MAAGLVTRDRLYGPRFRRLFPDVYAPAAAEPDLLLRSRAAGVYIGGRGVLVGYSAAELLGASCASANAPAEVTVPDGCRGRPGLVVHRFRPAPGEVADEDGIALTTAVRTAYDLGRRPDHSEAVVAIDALARGRFPLGALLELAAGHRGDRGLRDLRREAYVTRLGWDMLRLDAATVFSPRAVAIRVQRELVARGAASAAPVTARW